MYILVRARFSQKHLKYRTLPSFSNLIALTVHYIKILASQKRYISGVLVFIVKKNKVSLIKVTREDVWDFLIFTGYFLNFFTANFIFHGLNSSKFFTPTFTGNFKFGIRHVLLLASRALFPKLFTGY